MEEINPTLYMEIFFCLLRRATDIGNTSEDFFLKQLIIWFLYIRSKIMALRKCCLPNETNLNNILNLLIAYHLQ